MLECIDSKYVLIFLEDFLLRKPVDSQRVAQLVNLAVERKVGCLRLVAGLPLAFPPSRPVPGLPGIGVIDKGEPYRVSAQAAIWEVSVLRQLLVPGMTAWEFEEIGTMLSTKFSEPFWAVYESAIEYSQCVEKGKWKPEGLKICREAGVIVNPELRPAFSSEELEDYFKRQNQKNQLFIDGHPAINKLIERDALNGREEVLSSIKKTPFEIKLWCILIFSMAPSLYSIYRRLKLNQKLRLIRNRI
jgi:hypothetical protein